MAYDPFESEDTSSTEYDPFAPDEEAAPKERGSLLESFARGGERAISGIKTSMTGNDPKRLAELVTEAQNNIVPQTPAQLQMAAEIAPYQKAYDEAQGADAIVPFLKMAGTRLGQWATNPVETAHGVVESLPNSAPGLIGSIVGGVVGATGGSAVPVVGSALGGIAGSIAGGTAGGYGIEQGLSFQERAVRLAQEKGIDPKNVTAMEGVIRDNYDQLLSESRGKGIGTAFTDAVLTRLTLHIGTMGERAIAKDVAELTKGIKAGTVSAEQGAAALASIEARQAARATLKSKAIRAAGITGGEMVGESLSEATGQKLGYGEVDALEAIDEGALALGQGAVMAAASKTASKALGLKDGGLVEGSVEKLRAALAGLSAQEDQDAANTGFDQSLADYAKARLTPDGLLQNEPFGPPDATPPASTPPAAAPDLSQQVSLTGAAAAGQNMADAGLVEPAFNDEISAQSSLSAREDGDNFEVVPHPRIKGKFTVAPRSQQSIDDEAAAALANQQSESRVQQVAEEEGGSVLNAPAPAKTGAPSGVTFDGQPVESIRSPKGAEVTHHFTTSQGSEYVLASDGAVRRNKSEHKMHDANDKGVKEWHENSAFFDPKDDIKPGGNMNPISLPVAAQAAMEQGNKISINTAGGVATVMIYDKAAKNWRTATLADSFPASVRAGKTNYAHIALTAPVSSLPVVGHNTLEWTNTKIGAGVAKMHAGSPVSAIAEVTSPAEKARAKAEAAESAEVADKDETEAAAATLGGEAKQSQGIDSAAHEAATSPKNDKTEPTDGQKGAGNYAKGHATIAGMGVSIENPEGSTRAGTDPDGKSWSTTMRSHYGYFKRSEGSDGDNVDVFVKPGTPENYSGPVWVIDQKNADGSFDEVKVMLGWGKQTEQAVIKAYRENYSAGWDGVKSITQTSLDEFKAWLRSGDTTKAFAERESSEDLAPPIDFGIKKSGSRERAGAPNTGQATETAREKTAEEKVANDELRVETPDADIAFLSRDELPNSFGAPKGVPTRQLHDSLSRLAKLFGKKIQFFYGNLKADGFVRKSDPDTIYLRANSGIHLGAVLGHELLHMLKREVPTAYDALSKVIRGALGSEGRKKFDAYYNAAAVKSGGTTVAGTALIEEAVADLLGNRFTEADFWTDVFSEVQKQYGAEAQGIIQRLSQAVIEILQKVINAFGGQKFQTDKMIGDHAKEVKAALVKATAEYMKRSKQGLTSGTGETKFSSVKEHSLEIERADRDTSDRSRLSAAEMDAVRESAKKHKLTITEVADAVREVKKTFPVEAGWAPITFVGIDSAVFAKKPLLSQDTLKFKKIPYGFHLDRNGKDNKVTHKKRVKTVAGGISGELLGVYAKFKSGDKNAAVTIRQIEWYRKVAALLHHQFGGFADFLAQLLGPTSANTPVENNTKYAIEALRLAMSGKWDKLIADVIEWNDRMVEAGKKIDAFLEANAKLGKEERLSKKALENNEAFKALIMEAARASEYTGMLPVQVSGAKFGMATLGIQKVLANAWGDFERGDAPKTKNFYQNLIGRQFEQATIDVWAARSLRRFVNELVAPAPRLPTVAEKGVTGDIMADGKTPGGEYGFGVEVMTEAAKTLHDSGIPEFKNVTPADVQAMIWFSEKELWATRNWTTKQGEGGSLEAELDLQGFPDRAKLDEIRVAARKGLPHRGNTKPNVGDAKAWAASGDVGTIYSSEAYSARLQKKIDAAIVAREAARHELESVRGTVDRWIAGISPATDFTPSDQTMAATGKDLHDAVMSGPSSDKVIAFKAAPTKGRYGYDEHSIDFEGITRSSYDGNEMLKAVLETAKKNVQDGALFGRVLRADEKVDYLKHRPGLELYFAKGQSMDAVQPLLDKLTELGFKQFTFVVDPRRTPASLSGKIGDVVGLRYIFTPEFALREPNPEYGGDQSWDSRNLSDDQIRAKVEAKSDELAGLADELRNVEGISFSEKLDYEADVYFWGDYDDALGAIGKRLGDSAQEKQWSGDGIRSGLERANRRREVDPESADAKSYETGRDVLRRNGGPKLSRSRSDAAGGGWAGRSSEEAVPGRGVSATGIHYSGQERKTLASSMFGAGLKGAELDRIKNAADLRLKHRIYFYVNGGRGINPEDGVGAHAHRFQLENLYDTEADPQDLGANINGDYNLFESRVIDAGFDGHVSRSKGIAVLLGQRNIEVEYLGVGRKDAPLAEAAEPSAFGRQQRAVMANNVIPAGQTTGADWKKIMAKAMPDIDVSHLEDDKKYFRSDIVKRPSIQKSTERLTESQKNNLLSGWLALTEPDEAFTYPISTSKDFATIVKTIIPDTNAKDVSKSYLTDAEVKAGKKQYRFDMAGNDAFVIMDPSDKTVWVNLASLKEGSGGSAVYAATANWAFNNGYVFIGDPTDISTAGIKRRLENMIATALKFRTTDHIRPHVKQMDYLRDNHGIDMLWHEGDTTRNLKAMLEASYLVNQALYPEIDNVKYSNGVFLDRKTGGPADLEAVAERARRDWSSDRGVGAAGIRTLKRAVVSGALVRGTDQEGGGSLLESVLQGDGPSIQGAGGLQYSRSRGPFYSQLTNAVGQAPAKLDNVPAGQWKLWLANGAPKLGVKLDEIHWSGVMDWLDTQGKNKVSKADVIAYLDQGGVRISETTLSNEPDYDDVAEFMMGLGYSRSELADMPIDEALDEARERGYEPKGETKFESYQLPGGENYRELLLTLPPKIATKKQTYQEWVAGGMQGEWSTKGITSEPAKFASSHFPGHNNILAHIRFNERTDANGNRVLFIEEIQSDWGQKGKKDGFGRNEQTVAEAEAKVTAILEEAKEAMPNEDWDDYSNDEAIRAMRENGYPAMSMRMVDAVSELRSIENDTRVPAAPFVTDTKAWTALALKRMIAYAAQNGFDSIAWTTGEQQAERYDLSKQIKQVIVEKYDGELHVKAYSLNDERVITETVGPKGLEDLIGKDAADKALKQIATDEEAGSPRPKADLRGLDLKVGGEGMKGFYDQIVPQVANDVLRKIGGGKVVEIDVGNTKTAEKATRATISGREEWRVLDADDNVIARFQSEQAANTFIEKRGGASSSPQPGFEITEPMRAKVKAEGLPLFSPSRQTETPEFKRWSKGAPVFSRDDTQALHFYSGKPAVVEVLHGTTGDFSAFDRKKATAESDWGAGFYFTNNEEDVGNNYAGEGPDLTNRIQYLAERIASDTNREYDDPEVIAEAKKRLAVQHQGMVMPVYVRFDNPAVIGGPGETFLDFDQPYNERTEEYGAPRGTLQRFINALDKASEVAAYGAHLDELKGEIYVKGLESEGLKLSELAEVFAYSESVAYAGSNDGTMVGKEILRRALEAIGFDGVIDQTVGEKFEAMLGMDLNTVHFIAFKPTQIKSAIGNSGAFNPRSPDIRKSAERAVTETPEFKAWFGDSKVVDAEGKPLVVYHGTYAAEAFDNVPDRMRDKGNITTFDRLYTTRFRAHSLDTLGSWFSTNPGDGGALMYAGGGRQIGGVIYPVYLSIQNPHETTFALLSRRGRLLANGKDDGRNLGKPEVDAIRTWLKTMGKDGIKIVHDEGAPSGSTEFKEQDAWIALEPEQIKSATGNRGTFNPNDPDIRRSASRQAVADALSDVDFRFGVANNVKFQLADIIAPAHGLNFWHRTVGTQFHKAMAFPPFKAVFDLVQRFLDDIQLFSLRAEGKAPDIFPKLDKMSWANLKKMGMSAADNALIGKALSEGTLQNGPGAHDGVVWSDADLRSRYQMTAEQIKLYRQARAAINQSLEELAASEMAQHLRVQKADMVAVERVVRSNLPLRDKHAALTQILDAHALANPGKDFSQTRTHLNGILSTTKSLQNSGYAPLMRFGDRTVTGYDQAGKVTFFTMVDTTAEADALRRQLQATGLYARLVSGKLDTESFKLFKGVTPDTLELFANHAAVPMNDLMQEYLELAVSNRSAMKRLITRQGTAGFSTDATRVMASFLTSNGRKASTNLNMVGVKQAVEDIPQNLGDIKADAAKLVEYVQSPGEEAAKLRGFLFLNFLGGSIAAGIVNLTQPVMMTLPYLSRYGVGKASAAMTAALKQTSQFLSGKTVSDPDLQAALLRAQSDGHINPQEMYQLMAAANAGAGSLFAYKFQRVWGLNFSVTEAFNRTLTFSAAYQLAKGAGSTQAYEDAVKAVFETQGLYNKGNRPNWARGAVGATIFTFKQYSISYMEFLRRLWTQGTMPKRQLGLALGLLLLAAGANGLPGGDDLDDIIDTVGAWLGYATNSKRWKREHLQKLLGKEMGDLALIGISKYLPADVQARLGLANLFPGTGLLNPIRQDRTREVTEVFGVAGSLAKSIADTAESIAKNNPRAAALSILPTALKNAYYAAEMAETGKYKDRGNKLVTEVTLADAVLKGGGFQPTKVSKVQKAITEATTEADIVRMRKEEFTTRIADAVADGDQEAREKATKDLLEWNRNNPEYRISIEPGALRRAVQLRRMSKDTRFIKQIPKTIRGRVLEDLNEAQT